VLGGMDRSEMRFFRALTFRVFVGSCVLLFSLFALYSYFAVRYHNQGLMSQVLDSATRVSDIIKQSTHYSMLLNRSDDVYQIITTIGREPGVEGIRIYNKKGAIIFSTDESEELTTVDMRAEACIVCHGQGTTLQSLPPGNRARTYRGPKGHRVIGLINPIRNEALCSNAACHAHPPDRTVLGVLDVRMSLERVDANIAKAKQTFILYALAMTLVMALATGCFLYVAAHRPVQRLMEGARQIASGNLEYQIQVASADEIGELAHEFNKMTNALRMAEQENRTWSDTLEKRVQEKTEELKRIHDQILQIEKLASLGKLSATVAHELNNPLEGILTYAKLISKRLQKPENQAPATKETLEDLDLIIQEVQRCGNIVKNLLLFSKKRVGEFGLVSIQSIIEKAVQLMQHHFKISNVQLEEEVQASDATIMCDESQIQQALIALCVNAVEAMPGGGKLTISTSLNSSGDLQVKVADSGSGIAPEDLPHIFEPFFSTKKEGKGVGLGLSIVFGIMERHGGTIAVASEINRGTVFTLTFPPVASHKPRIESVGTLTSQSTD
jgi:two-component system NtrC family sensor kinase